MNVFCFGKPICISVRCDVRDSIPNHTQKLKGESVQFRFQFVLQFLYKIDHKVTLQNCTSVQSPLSVPVGRNMFITFQSLYIFACNIKLLTMIIWFVVNQKQYFQSSGNPTHRNSQSISFTYELFCLFVPSPQVIIFSITLKLDFLLLIPTLQKRQTQTWKK